MFCVAFMGVLQCKPDTWSFANAIGTGALPLNFKKSIYYFLLDKKENIGIPPI
jgi:hypothetical protein